MALYPSADKLDSFPSRFVLTNLAARRAKQLREGAPPLIETNSTHPLTIALEEIAEGAVVPKFVDGEVVPASGLTGQAIEALAAEATPEAQDLANLVKHDASIEDLLDLENAFTDVEEEVEGVDLSSLTDDLDEDDDDLALSDGDVLIADDTSD